MVTGGNVLEKPTTAGQSVPTNTFWQYASPIGTLWLTMTQQAVTALSFNAPCPSSDASVLDTAAASTLSSVALQAGQWLDAYFAGEKPSLRDFPMEIMTGTSFQRDAWEGLQQIPYGTTWTYGQLAKHIGRPLAVRAVGQANRMNPLAVVIPCHRVIGADGKLTGYMGLSGISLKQQLLDFESRYR